MTTKSNKSIVDNIQVGIRPRIILSWLARSYWSTPLSATESSYIARHRRLSETAESNASTLSEMS